MKFAIGGGTGEISQRTVRRRVRQPSVERRRWRTKSGIADKDGLENSTFTCQWLSDEAAIQGATGSTHTLADSDEGMIRRVQVSSTGGAGNKEALTNSATDAVNDGSVILNLLNRDAPGDHSITGYQSLRLRGP